MNLIIAFNALILIIKLLKNRQKNIYGYVILMMYNTIVEEQQPTVLPAQQPLQ